MSKIVKYDHRTIQEVESIHFKDIDPSEIDFSKIKSTASVIKKYLESEDKDPYTVAVKSRGAMNSISECLRIASQMYAFYHAEAKRQYAIAKLERAEDWFKKNKPDTKITDGLRATYADLDEEYQVAKKREYAAQALIYYLRNKHGDFSEDLNLAKKKMGIDSLDESKSGYDNIKDEEEYDG